MSIWSKMYKWWEQGARTPSVVPHRETIKTYRVVFADSRPAAIVRAATMDNHGGSVTFTLGGKIVASYPSAGVVGVEVKS